jgi:hypothetical protein
MASWAVVATVKAPDDKVLAFAAHHLSLGAGHVWLFFDDPEARPPADLASHPRVSATVCDAAHWERLGRGRPDQHQFRQTLNARYAYHRTRTDWLLHIDVDEFLHASRPVDAILDDAAPSTLVMKLEPFEAMHDPLLPDDVYTAREFRGALRHEVWKTRWKALGPYRRIIRDGMLSHTVGKVIFRTKIPKLRPKLHAVLLEGDFVRVPDWHPELRLLHFHAQDQAAWLDALPFRLTKGAYQFRPDLKRFLQDATPKEIEKFYLRTQVLSVDLADELQKLGRVVVADLGLRAKVQALRDGTI